MGIMLIANAFFKQSEQVIQAVSGANPMLGRIRTFSCMDEELFMLI